MVIPDIPGSVQLKIDIDATIAKLVLDDDNTVMVRLIEGGGGGGGACYFVLKIYRASRSLFVIVI